MLTLARRRRGRPLRALVVTLASSGLAGPLLATAPASERIAAEIARLEVRACYGASLEYARNTEPKSGLFYVGQAQAARDFVRLCREVATPPASELSLRSLAPELAALQRELLVAYRPPLALLLHSEFIAASSLLNDAVELDAAGFRHGALLRYLQAVVAGFDGAVRFVAENYGDSALAKKFGVTRYPALFVDDILVATPDDFGFYGKGAAETGGRYAPLHTAAADRGIARFQDVELPDLDGEEITAADRANRVVLVDFWATWCPPCRATLPWLGTPERVRAFGDISAVPTLLLFDAKGDGAARFFAAPPRLPAER